MRILLYGFGPYRHFSKNITATIVKAVPRQPGLRKVVFPVRFDRGQFIGVLKKHRPDIVVGLGQSSRRQIEIEARAANRRRAGKQERARPIRRNGPRWLATTLTLKRGGRSRHSRNAGDYVCNYSMYVALDHIKRNRLGTVFGFLHIPYDYDPREAANVVRKMLGNLRSSSR